MQRATASWIRHGQSLHLHHGPISLLVQVEGRQSQCEKAYAAAATAFAPLLESLVSELPRLRTELKPGSMPPNTPVGRIMYEACIPFLAERVTPMASVAGAVAQFVLTAICEAADLKRAWINNGGDIAFFLTPGSQFDCGIIPNLQSIELEGVVSLGFDSPCRGIATSGRATRGQGGRSFSLGIADAVTVIAEQASVADAAATLIANHIDLPGHPGVIRQRANQIEMDTDLGEREVVVKVLPLSFEEVSIALDRGVAVAEQWIGQGYIHSAVLCLAGFKRILGGSVLLPSIRPDKEELRSVA